MENLKGTVQQKLRGVESDLNQKVFGLPFALTR
jgi:hypothetical protein